MLLMTNFDVSSDMNEPVLEVIYGDNYFTLICSQQSVNVYSSKKVARISLDAFFKNKFYYWTTFHQFSYLEDHKMTPLQLQDPAH